MRVGALQANGKLLMFFLVVSAGAGHSKRKACADARKTTPKYGGRQKNLAGSFQTPHLSLDTKQRCMLAMTTRSRFSTYIEGCYGDDRRIRFVRMIFYGKFSELSRKPTFCYMTLSVVDSPRTSRERAHIERREKFRVHLALFRWMGCTGRCNVSMKFEENS